LHLRDRFSRAGDFDFYRHTEKLRYKDMEYSGCKSGFALPSPVEPLDKHFNPENHLEK